MPIPKCDFIKVAKQLIFSYFYFLHFIALQRYWNQTSAWVSSCKFTSHFQNTFS